MPVKRALPSWIWLAPMLALACAAGVVGAAPAQQPPASTAESGLRCSGTAAVPARLDLQLGKSTLMRLPEPVLSRSVGNPAIVQALLVAPDTLYVVGVDVGATNMIVQGRSGACSVIDLAVTMDVGALQATLAALMPDEKDIRVSAAADTLVLSGTVADAMAMERVLQLAAAYVRRPAQALHERKDEPAAPIAALPLAMAGSMGGAAASAGGGASARIVNLLNVAAPQQVMLEVKIAEVSKSLLDQLEMGAALHGGAGSWTATLMSNFLTGTLTGSLGIAKSNGNQLTAQAANQDGLVRMLAEPTVMAISGQEGSFLAGGKIFVPVAQDNNKVTLEEKEFGIGLHFTPTVLAGGRINLKVAPEVSDISPQGVGVTLTGAPGTTVLPLMTTRRASTTVQLMDGQSFAIGGLIKNNQTTNIKGLPVLGEVPVLGALFRSTDFQHDRTELLFVVTVHLVKPLPPDYVLPTDRVLPAGRAELFLGGRMEGRAPAASAAAPATQQVQGFELK